MVAATPERRALGRVGGSIPRSHARPIPRKRRLARATRRSRLEQLVAELGEKISRDSLERDCIGSAHLRPPVADAARRRLEEALMVRLRRHVHGTGVLLPLVGPRPLRPPAERAR